MPWNPWLIFPSIKISNQKPANIPTSQNKLTQTNQLVLLFLLASSSLHLTTITRLGFSERFVGSSIHRDLSPVSCVDAQKSSNISPLDVEKTYGKNSHILEDMLDFSISVRKGWADSAAIALRKKKQKEMLQKEFPNLIVCVFLAFLETETPSFSPQTQHQKRSNLRKPTLPLESPGFAGLHGDNLVAWLVSCWTFFKKGISWKKSMEDGLMIKHSMFLICLHGRSMEKQKLFCLRMWFRGLFWTETTSLVLFYPKCIQL